MTTMDSDSESQDSDEGRRFRFEATRKDAITTIQSHRRNASPRRNNSGRRSRSRDRGRRNRNDGRQSSDRKKESRSNYEDRRSSKEQKGVTGDFRRRDEHRHKDRDSKNSHKDSRDSVKRDSRSRDVRDSKSRDDKRKRSRDRNRDSKTRDKYRKYSRDRERLNKKSLERDRSRDKKIRSNEKEKTDELQHKNNEKLSDSHECKDLNLSDFDIVSDTEGNSDNSDEILQSKRDKFDRKRDNSEDSDKVNIRNGDKSSGPSFSNPDEISDFLLASTSTKSTSNNSQTELDKTDAECNSNVDQLNEKGTHEFDNSEECYGPVLPPSIAKKTTEGEKIIGPSLPEHLRMASINDGDDEDEGDTFGPALPPHLQKKGRRDIVGPELPENADSMEIGSNEDNEDDEGGALGPLPADHPTFADDLVQQQLEYRARIIKRELAKIDNVEDKKREEWMTELPSVHTANLGLGPRKFRTRAGPDLSDRSDWTDTPADRERKRKEQAMGKGKVDKQPEEVVPEKSSRRKEKSLLEVHQKKLHKKKKKEEKEAKKSGKPVRRPFDRDIDLQVNRFDEARKKSIFMKAAALDDRFSRGKI